MENTRQPQHEMPDFNSETIWEYLQREFRSGKVLLEEFKPVPDEDFKEWHLERACDLVSSRKNNKNSRLQKQMRSGYYEFYRPKEQIEDITHMVESLFKESNGQSTIDTLQNAILNKELTGELIKSWGRFQLAVGSVSILYLLNDEARRNFGTMVKNKGDHISRYIYAVWMQKNWKKFGIGKLSKEEAISKLENEILNESEYEHLSVLKNMLNSHDFLKKTYVDISANGIADILEGQWLPKSSFPKFLKNIS